MKMSKDKDSIESNLQIYLKLSSEMVIREGVLSELEADILHLRLVKKYKYADIGNKHGLSVNQVSRIFKRSIKLIREMTINQDSKKIGLLHKKDKSNALAIILKQKERINKTYSKFGRETYVFPSEYVEEENIFLDEQLDIISKSKTKDNIRNLYLSTRTFNALLRSGIISVKQIEALIYEDKLDRIRNLGKKGYNELEKLFDKI